MPLQIYSVISWADFLEKPKTKHLKVIKERDSTGMDIACTKDVILKSGNSVGGRAKLIPMIAVQVL